MKSAKQFTTNVVSALTARTRLGQIIKRATQQDERFVAGRRGEPSAVMTFSPMPKELRAMQATARQNGMNTLTPGQIDRLVSAARKEKHPRAKRRSK